MLQILIGYATWLIFVVTWNVFARRTTTTATAGEHRERFYKLVIAFGMVMIVLAALRPLPLWTNPEPLARTPMLVPSVRRALGPA